MSSGSSVRSAVQTDLILTGSGNWRNSRYSRPEATTMPIGGEAIHTAIPTTARSCCTVCDRPMRLWSCRGHIRRRHSDPKCKSSAHLTPLPSAVGGDTKSKRRLLATGQRYLCICTYLHLGPESSVWHKVWRVVRWRLG